MTSTIVRSALSSPPRPAPLVGTLLDAADVTQSLGSFVDPTGLYLSYNCLDFSTETAFPCPATVLAAPVLNAPTTNTTGGTLAAGTYRAILTAINSRGETVGSPEVSRVTTGATSTATFTWTDLTGETGYRLYLTNGAANSEAQYVPIAAGTTTYTMTSYPPSGAVGGVVPSANSAVISATKSFAAFSDVSGFRFAVYGGLVCKAVGFETMDVSEAEVTRVFLNNESVGVEKAMMQTRFRASGTLWGAPTDLTPAGGAVGPSVGLAILEGHAASRYAGTPTIHTSRTIGSLLWDKSKLTQRGEVYYSPQGSKVASGGGYEAVNTSPAGVAAPAGERWMYATGEVSLLRSEIKVEQVVNTTTNEVFVLGERLYVASVDCYTAAVRVKVE